MAIKLGEQNIGKITLGDRPVKKVMLGDRLVFHKDFEFLDSVESTGVQFIDTNIVPTQNSSTNIIFKQENDGIDENPFGSRKAAYHEQYTIFQGGQQRLFYAIGIKNYEIRGIEGVLFSNICDLTFSPYNFRLKYNNKTLEFNNPTFDASELANAIKMYLFGLNQNYSLTRNFTGKIYRFNHNDSNSIDLIPCQNKTTKEIGMYDKISGQFFGNSGSGQFFGWHKNGDIALPLITQSFDFSHIDFSLDNAIKILDALQPVSTPQTITFSAYTTSIINASNNALAKVYDAVQKGWTIVGEGLNDYVELEYIESTGTQWINTGILANQDTSIKTKFRFTEIKETSGNQAFGCRETIGGSFVAEIFAYNPNTSETSYGYSYVRYGKDIITVDRYPIPIGDYEIELRNGYYKISIDGNTREYNRSIQTFQNQNATIGLFAINYVTWRGFGKLRMHYFKIGQIDLVPAKRMSDGAIGMIDKISGQWYGNSGTGSFIGGEPKQD